MSLLITEMENHLTLLQKSVFKLRRSPLLLDCIGWMVMKQTRNRSVKVEGKEAFPVHIMRACKGSRGTGLAILCVGPCWKLVVFFRLRPLYANTPEVNRVTDWTGGWVGSRTGLGVLETTSVSYTHLDLNFGPSSPWYSCSESIVLYVWPSKKNLSLMELSI
jgi:hypothetical protein